MTKRQEETAVPAVRDSGTPTIYSAEDIEALRETYFRGMTEGQVRLAVKQAERQGVDLFSGEAVTFSTQGRTVLFVTIQGLRARAARSGRYLPGAAADFVDDPSNKHPKQATAHVRIWDERGNAWIDVSEGTDWREYGSNRGAWQTHPWTMLAKCAEAKLLRRCFPVELVGMYIPEEMQHERHTTLSCLTCGAEVTPAQAALAIKAYGRQLCGQCAAKTVPATNRSPRPNADCPAGLSGGDTSGHLGVTAPAEQPGDQEMPTNVPAPKEPTPAEDPPSEAPKQAPILNCPPVYDRLICAIEERGATRAQLQAACRRAGVTVIACRDDLQRLSEEVLTKLLVEVERI